jgi:hypothetical protein
LRKAAASQRDTYHRRWFVQLADQLDEVLAERSSRFSFMDSFGSQDDQIEDDFDVDFDPDCDCAECQAARERAQERASQDSPF